MVLNVKIDLSEVNKLLKDTMPKVAKNATVATLTDAAWYGNTKIKQAMKEKFKGGATNFSLKAFKVERATTGKFESSVGLRVDGQGKGGLYNEVLEHLFHGGNRAYKNMERAFKRIGLLTNGDIIVPGAGCPLDSFGNPRSGFVTQIISYFAGFSEQGYKANMTPENKRNLAKYKTTKRGYQSIGGAVYFVSRGKGNWFGARSWRSGRSQHLPPGIWKKKGIHGAKLQPVFMFVKRGTYKQIISLDDIADQISQKMPKIWQEQLAIAHKKETGA